MSYISKTADDFESLQLEQDVKNATAAVTMESLDDLILVDTSGGAVTVTLPWLIDAQLKPYRVKRIAGASNVTVSGSGTETIDGGSVTLANIYDFVVVVPEPDVGWWVVGS